MKNMIVKSDGFSVEDISHNGNKFLVGNGYFGIRGTLEEYTKENMCAINLAGVYDKAGEGWRESVNAPSPLYTCVKVNGILLSVIDVQVQSHVQILDFERGIHKRETSWHLAGGNVTVNAERFASMADQHFIGMKYSVCADFDCDIELISGIDGDVWDINGPHFVTLNSEQDGKIKRVTGITGEKGIAVTTEEVLEVSFDADRHVLKQDKSILERIRFKAYAGQTYSFNKVASVCTSVDQNVLCECVDGVSYEALRERHVAAWKAIWDISYVEIDGDDEAEYALNYSLYHLNSIAPRNMSSMSIAARGLSGQVYKGAVFWDTEMFMVDYFLYTEPEIVKTLLKYRVDTLAGALDKAKSYGFEGAFYAWESHEGGFDACSDYNVVDVFTKRPMRTFFRDKQVHISAAIVYALEKYVRVTGDDSILKNGGADVIYECARFYRSIMLRYANRPYFEIHDVIGPDEYHERVNNNAYTNAMARFALQTAVKYADYIDADTSEFASLADQLKKPYVNEDGIIEQFDGYFELEDCSVDTVRSRLLDPKEYWGGAYGVASHTKVIKQADVVAMLCVMPGEFTKEDMLKNLRYYEPRTEHGSSLSACMYSLLSCKIGDADYAYPLFMKSAKVDLLRGGKEWAGCIYIGGTHPASEGGAWKVAIEGFAGMRIDNGKVVCNPCLPQKWNAMRFKINYNGTLYAVKVTKTDWSIKAL